LFLQRASSMADYTSEGYTEGAHGHLGEDYEGSSDDGPRQQWINEDPIFCSESSPQCVLDESDIFTSFGARAANGVRVASSNNSPVSRVQHVPRVVDACRMLGKGSYSEVWHCVVEGLAVDVAVKVLQQGVTLQTSSEYSTLKDASHPNLVSLLDIVEGPINAFFLELCLGGTIAQFLYDVPGQAVTCFTLDQRLKPAHEVAAAVAYLHSRDIMHRDIKASNVLLADVAFQGMSELPPAKLGDLGLARMVQGAEMTPCVGTPLYMAPENMGGCEYGKPADVFSVAILCNEICVGERPYSKLGIEGAHNSLVAASVAKMTLIIMQGGRPRPCEDASVQHMCLACWNAEPAVRWPAAAVAGQLQERISRSGYPL